MKKLLLGFIFIFLLIPGVVFAESNLIIDCNESNIAGEKLTCFLKTIMDEGVTYDKLQGNLNLNSKYVSFEWEQGFDGSLNNNVLTIDGSSEVGTATIGKMNIKFPSDVTGNKRISLDQIKMYKNSELLTLLNNASDNVLVKSDVNTLESLTLSDCDNCKLSPNFSSNLTIYAVTTSTDTITFEAKASGNATVSGDGTKNLTKEKETFEIIVTSEAGNTKKYKITVTKKEGLSSDNLLKSLSLDTGKFDTEFSSDVTNYTATVDKEEVVINAEVNDSKAKVTGTGKKKLEYGKNEFNIIVTAENGISKNYLITINRPDKRSDNAYLKELTINNQKINFDKDIFEYQLTVSNEITKLDVNAIPEIETSTVTIVGDKELIVGENEIIITVLAEDESEKEYTIVVTREAMQEIVEDGLYLDNIVIEGYDIEFSKEKFEYNIVIKDEKTLKIDAIPINENYNVEILGNSDLKSGSIIKIIVTDEEENSNIYKIKISVDSNTEDKNENSDINYIPIIMTSLLIILVILNILQIIKRFRKK